VATSDPIELAAEILTAFVANNSVPRAELAALFEGLHAALKRLANRGEVAPAVIETPEPAVSIRKSVTPDYLICLDDGRQFKSLRRHLTKLGMTPEQYRLKWNLPGDYPMVASNYAAQRSALAKSLGLGQLRKKPVAAVPASADTIDVVAAEPASVAKTKRKTKSKVVAAPPKSAGKRKAARRREATD
jgi:predicted transcriptional regulator